MTRLALIIDWPNGNVPWKCWSSIWHSDIRREPDVILLRGCAPTLDLTGNMAVKTALAKGADEIMFLSADQSVPPDVLARFRAHGVEAVGALTATRQESKKHEWIVYNFNQEDKIEYVEPHSPLTRADVVGIGCSWFKADVFRRIPPPWFQNIVSPDGCSLMVSSDFFMFRKLKEYGVSTYLDATMESPHEHDKLLTAKSLHRTAPFLVEVH